MPSGRDPRGDMDVHADVSVRTDARLAGVEPHAHAHSRVALPRFGGPSSAWALRIHWPRLPAGAAADCGKAAKKRVALHAHFRSAMGADGVTHELGVAAEDRGVALTELGEQASGTLDIGEQEGHRTDR